MLHRGSLPVTFTQPTSDYDSDGFGYSNSFIDDRIIKQSLVINGVETYFQWVELLIQSRLDDGNGGLTDWQDENRIVVPVLTEPEEIEI